MLLAPACDRDDLTDGPKRSRVVEEEEEEEAELERPDGVKVKINEIMLENEATLADENGAFSPWIEIHNPSDAEFTLAGVGLSDDLVAPEKWVFPESPASVIGPQGFVVVFLDGDPGAGDLHTNFTVTPGAPLTLALGGGTDDFLVGFDTSAAGPDQSLGRSPDGDGSLALLAEPSPGAPNGVHADGVAKAAKFLRGDSDDDGRRTFADVVRVLEVLSAAAPVPDCADRADVDDDGVIDFADVALALEFLAGRASRIPEPYASAGVDPTPDALDCRESR